MANHKHFEILRWDVIEDPCTGQLSPMAYFVPTTDFIINSKLNDNRIYINLFDIFKDNGDEMYKPSQTTRTLAVIDVSSEIPNCRTNFFNETNSYVLYLKELPWNGYVDLSRKPKFLIDEHILTPDSIKQEFNEKSGKNNEMSKDVEQTVEQKQDIENFSPQTSEQFQTTGNSEDAACPPDCCDNYPSRFSPKLSPLEITLMVVSLIFLFLLIFGGLSIIKKAKQMKQMN